MKTKGLFYQNLFSLMMIIILGWNSNQVIGQATVWTDKDDYAPGEIALISGGGWWSGETIDIHIASTHAAGNYYLTTIADGSGEFSNINFPIYDYHLGEEFILMAFGNSSGYEAVTFFTDATWTLTGSYDNLCGGIEQRLSFTIKQTNNASPRNSSFRIKFPAGFELNSASLVAKPNSKNWTISVSGNSVCLNAQDNSNTHALANNDELVFEVNVKPTNLLGEYILSGFGLGDFTTCPTSGQAITPVAGSSPSVLKVTKLSAEIIGQPSDQNVTYGADALFEVFANNATFYQWQINTGNGFSDISGETGSSLTIANPIVSMTGYQYRVSVTNNTGCGTITSNAVSLTVNQLTITGNFTADNKVYDGNTDAVVLSRTLNGVVTGDDVSLVGGTASFADKNVDDDITVTLTGATLSGDQAANYSLTSMATTLANITAKPITGNFTADNKVYDGNTDAVVLSRMLNDVVTGDDVSLTGGTASFADKNVDDDILVTLTGATLSGDQAGNYSLTGIGTTLANITAKPITGNFTADSKVYNGNTDAVVLTRTLNSVVAGDNVSLVGGTASFADKNVADDIIVTLTGATLAGDQAGNYSLTGVGTTLANITAKPITGSFTADNKVYDGNTDAVVLSRMLNDVVTGDDVSLTGGTASFADKNAADDIIVTLTGATLAGDQAGNYSLTGVGTTIANITTKFASVIVADKSKGYGEADPVFTGTLSGFLAVDNVIANYSRDAGETVLDGPYLISAVLSPEAVLSNYYITNTPGELTITPKAAILIFIGSRLMATDATNSAILDLMINISCAQTVGNLLGEKVVVYVDDKPEYVITIGPDDLVDEDGYHAIIIEGHKVTLTADDNNSRTFTIRAEMHGNFAGALTDVIAIVYTPGKDHITGGGFIVAENSTGVHPAAFESHVNFGFNMKYVKIKTLMQLQGEANVVYRSVDGVSYQFKSTSPVSLGINTVENTARFSVKGNLTSNQVVLEDLIMNVVLQDNGNPGRNDFISFTIWNGNQLIFSSNWNGISTQWDNLSGGNLVIHSGGTNAEGIELRYEMSDVQKKEIDLSVFPNPFREKVVFSFTPEYDVNAVLQVFSLNGALIETLYQGEVSHGLLYQFEFRPTEINTSIMLYRIVLGNEVYSGRILNNR
jgi:hypothetical protein